MTENEFRDMGNRLHISSALHHLRQVLFTGEGEHRARIKVFGIVKDLSELECELNRTTLIDE